jgi:hypothetical protein
MTEGIIPSRTNRIEKRKENARKKAYSQIKDMSKEGIIQKVFEKKLKEYSYMLSWSNVNHDFINDLKRTLIAEIKKIMLPRFDDEYVMSFEELTKILIGDYEK